MIETMSNPEPAPDLKKPAKLKRVLIGVVITIVMAAALYGAGWWQGRAELAAQKAEYESRLQVAQDGLEQTKVRLSVEANRGRLARASASLYRAALDLDQRNFGTANTHLQQAATALEQIEDVGGDLNIGRLKTLQNAISKTDLNVALDLEDQRAKVLGFADELNDLMSE